MIKTLTFITIFLLGMEALSSQTIDTLKVKDTILEGISTEREAKNKVFYEKIKDFFARYKLTKKLTNLIVVEERINSTTSSSTTVIPPKKISSYQGKIIRNIVITTLDPFGFDEKDLTKAPRTRLERYGNALHVKTRESTIRRFLLFKKDTPLDTLLLSETERVLRNQRYVRRAQVKALAIEHSQDSVDVEVNVLDSWSMYFDGDLAGNRGWTRLTEQNLFGVGHELSVIYQQYFSRFANNGKGFSYALRNIKNTYINVRTSYYSDYENYYSKSLYVERPLYSPLARWSGRVGYYENRYQDEGVKQGDSLYIPTLKTKTFDVFGSWVFPLKNEKNKQIRNFITAMRVRNISYFEKPTTDIDPQHYYANEHLFLTQFSLNSTGFIKDRYIFRNGDVEDVGVGHSVFLTSGVLWKKGNTLPYLGVGFSRARYIHRGYFSINTELGTFFEGNDTRETVFRGETTYFSKLFNIGDWHFRQFLRSSFVLGLNRNIYQRDRINLNGANGILGFSSSEVYGTRKLVLTSQTQVYAPFQFIGFRFSPFLSADLGFIGRDRTSFFTTELYSKISIGFYISNDYLPFGAIQFSFGYYPNIPNTGKNIFKFTGVTNDDFRLQSFSQRLPAIVPFK